MKKENSMAIIFGIIFGIVIAVVIIYYQSNQKKPQSIIKPAITPTIAIKNIDNPLTITQPQDRLITNSPEITIEGESKRGNLIIIQSPFYEIASKLNKDKFSFKFKLNFGENIIKITTYDKTQSNSKTFKAFYIQYE